MKIFIRLILLFLAAVICFSTTTACTDRGSPDIFQPAPDIDLSPDTEHVSRGELLAAEHGLPPTLLSHEEPVVFTFFAHSIETVPSPDNPAIEIIEAITNTRIEFIVHSGDLEFIIDVMLAAGDIPDMIFAGRFAEKVIGSGYFMPIEGLITDNAPNLLEHYAPWWDLMSSPDGHIYTAEMLSTSATASGWSKAYYRKLNDAFHLGLIDEESLTLADEQNPAAVTSGTVLDLHRKILSNENEFIPLEFIYPGITPDNFENRRRVGGYGINISKNISNPVRAIQFMDYLIHEDVQSFLQSGTNGEQWFFIGPDNMIPDLEQHIREINNRYFLQLITVDADMFDELWNEYVNTMFEIIK